MKGSETYSLKMSRKLADFPVFLGPHKKADCLGGRSIFRILLIFSIFAHHYDSVKLIRNIVRTGMAVKKKYHLTISPAGRPHKSVHLTESLAFLHSRRSEQCSVMALFARTLV